jgi:hypothetical protein
MAAPAAPPQIRFSDLSRRAKLCLLALLTVFVLGGLEVAARTYWWRTRGVPFAHPELAWKSFVEEWDRSGVEAVAPHHGDASFDVLLLGGSTLTDQYGTIPQELTRALQGRLPWPVRLVNLAAAGRVSFDSRLKYGWLEDRRFDLVIVYDGINDTPMNWVPPGPLPLDGSNVPRLRQLQFLRGCAEMRYLALPATMGYVGQRVAEKWRLYTHPRKEWAAYGADVRTPELFRANLEAIAAAARRRGDPLVLQTFANHIPPNYTDAAFAAKALSYDQHWSPVSIWGEPANVIAAVDAHNAVARAVAAEHPEVTFVDQRALIPGGKTHFNDCCHMTPAGCRLWVENLIAKLDLSALVRHRTVQRPDESGRADRLR